MDIPGDLELSMADIVVLGRCRALKTWFDENDLLSEFKTLIKGGTIPASVVLETGDPRAMKVVEARLRKDRADG